MKYSITEKKALKKLGIPDFRHMKKEHIIKFTSMLGKMDPEVAKKAIEQFPAFKDMATDIVSQFNNTLNQAMEKNAKSQDSFYAACKSVIASLQEELKMESIDAPERSRIEDKMILVAQMMGNKDSENKKFIAHMIAVGAAIGGISLAIGSSLLGNNSKISDHDNDDNDTEEL